MLSVWSRETDGGYLSRQAIGNHLRKHLGIVSPRGRRPMSDDLATAIRDRVHERLVDGEIEPGIKDGLGAQRLLEQRAADFADRELMARIALALTAQVKVIDPEVEALEAEYSLLLGDGTAGMVPSERPSNAERRGH
jgi:hypothetical protein